jgi:hypothetical protein
MATAAVAELLGAADCVSPLGIWLLRDYVSQLESAELLAAATRPAARWQRLSGRRVQALGGVVHERAGLLPAPLPSWLQPLLARLGGLAGGAYFCGLPPNHVLVNAYEPGDGIMAHQDGPLYHPAVAIVSLGAATTMQFTPHARLAESDSPAPPVVRSWRPQRQPLKRAAAAAGADGPRTAARRRTASATLHAAAVRTSE